MCTSTLAALRAFEYQAAAAAAHLTTARGISTFPGFLTMT
jgi:hypothetical protein